MLMDIVTTVIKTNFFSVGILDIGYSRRPWGEHLGNPSCEARIYAQFAATNWEFIVQTVFSQ